MRFITLAALAAGLLGSAVAQVNYTGGTYTQNFDSLLATGTSNAWTDNSTITGWFINKAVYAADTGSSNTGRFYSYGASSTDAERALGTVASGGSGTNLFGANFLNGLGANAVSFNLQYVGEQWRDGNNTTQQKLTFEYSLDATSLSDGTWTAVALLDFTGPKATTTAGALNGNLAENRASLSETVTLSSDWASNASLWIRWTDLNDAGNDHGLAVDDLSFSAQPVPEPATLAALGLGAMALIRRKRNK